MTVIVSAMLLMTANETTSEDPLFAPSDVNVAKCPAQGVSRGATPYGAWPSASKLMLTFYLRDGIAQGES